MGGGRIAVLTNRTGAAALRERAARREPESSAVTEKQALAERIAREFEAFLDSWHSTPETFDDALDAQIHRWYADVLLDKSRKVWPPKDMPYFSPSSANSDLRELYEKARGGKRDRSGQLPHQGRWTRVGTAIGDVIQRDILFAEKHMPTARFRFERNDRGEPMFEDFAKTSHAIEHNGRRFALYGTCDGIMRYITEDGEILRVGLEVKSKQTTSAQTSEYSTRNGAKEDHVKQAVCYSLMYDVDIYVILYVNASKKAWDMTEEDYAKNPDRKAFGVAITPDMQREVLDTFAEVVAMADAGTPPPLDLERWTFNGYKRACALSLSDEEYAEIERKVSAVMRSSLPEKTKREYADVLAQITKIRTEASA